MLTSRGGLRQNITRGQRRDGRRRTAHLGGLETGRRLASGSDVTPGLPCATVQSVAHPDHPKPGDDQLRCVYVNWVVADEDLWTAAWEQRGQARTMNGTRSEVIAWALSQPADRYWIFSSEADDYVPLREG